MAVRLNLKDIPEHLLTKDLQGKEKKSKQRFAAGFREIGDQRIYARSKWEANYGRYLEFLRARGMIDKWEHEPVTFWFDKIRRGVTSYKPDFRVTHGESLWYVEVKGHMDSRSRVTLKRMSKYHPQVEVRLVDSQAYKVLAKQCGSMISGWE